MRQRGKIPSREEIALLEPFLGLALDSILVPSTSVQVDHAVSELAAARFVGFDTESKPVFVKGVTSDGPHIVQFATLEKAYVFQLYHSACRAAASALLGSIDVVKVGFGLWSEQDRLPKKLGVEPRAVVDLDTVFRREGYRKAIGVKTAVALVLEKNLRKSRRMSTSNWARRELMPNQLLYAANDAYAAVKVFDALGLSDAEIGRAHV